MKPHPNILYLNTDPDSRIPQTTLDGIRRYAGVRGWEAEAFSSEDSRGSYFAALSACLLRMAQETRRYLPIKRNMNDLWGDVADFLR